MGILRLIPSWIFFFMFLFFGFIWSLLGLYYIIFKKIRDMIILFSKSWTTFFYSTTNNIHWKVDYLWWNLMKALTSNFFTRENVVFVLIIYLLIPIIYGALTEYNRAIEFIYASLTVSYLEIYILSLFLLLVWQKVYQSLTPLYAFWNLWSKIQSLTPHISESSERIQKEFSTDMNFTILSKWFATLASDFSKVSWYVLKLEQIEKKANKWNFFDSEKYISSLREDVLSPLYSLKKFLEQKKMQLEASQEELKNIQTQNQRIQVQVGWPDTLTGNADIQSKRTEPLIHELTENIEKLEVMIVMFS